MIHDKEILSNGPDLAQQSLDALQSPGVGELLRYRLKQIEQGHDQAADDQTPYRVMLAHFGRNYLQPIVDRTDGHPSPEEVEAAATSALKGAALLLALADKARREAATRRIAASQEEQSV